MVIDQIQAAIRELWALTGLTAQQEQATGAFSVLMVLEARGGALADVRMALAGMVPV